MPSSAARRAAACAGTRDGSRPAHSPHWRWRSFSRSRMLLVCLIIVPVLGALAAWLAALWGRDAPRWVALAALAAELGLVIAAAAGGGSAGGGSWLAQT